MMRYVLTILLSVFSVFSFRMGAQTQKDSVIMAINAIKTDDRYIYGEATMETLESSRTEAVECLMDSYVVSRGPAANRDEICIDTTSIQYCTHKRGRLFRTLAYIDTTILHRAGSQNDVELSSKKETDSVRKNRIGYFERQVSELATYANLRQLFFDPVIAGHSAVGNVSVMTRIEDIRACYIFLFGGDSMLTGAYSPVDDAGKRKDLINGGEVKIIKYVQGNNVVWVRID